MEESRSAAETVLEYVSSEGLNLTADQEAALNEKNTVSHRRTRTTFGAGSTTRSRTLRAFFTSEVTIFMRSTRP
ncbi:hypothetical protein DRB06_09980 [Actinomyces sp. Z5]|nr:hypothetical protein DRB06_09980 [Actinomyces sp. Z5]RAX22503.1 hypothetical protein DRB07_08225 [Actinomyces sp. Z3]